MQKITISDNKFTCPMLSKEISERGEITFGTCAKCKYNILHQLIDTTVYCDYGSSSTSEETTALSASLSELQKKVEENEALDKAQQEQIDANTTTNTTQTETINNQQTTIVDTVQSSVESIFTTDEMKENINTTINNVVNQQVAEQTDPWESYGAE